jgi:hypothetical protein
MADSNRMNIGQSSHQLIGIQFHKKRRDHLLHLEEVFHHPIESVRYVVHDYIEVDLIWFVAIGVERLAHLNAVRVMQDLQDLKFTVLVALILEDLLDGDALTGLSYGGLEYDTERAITYDFLSIICHTLLTNYRLRMLP